MAYSGTHLICVPARLMLPQFTKERWLGILQGSRLLSCCEAGSGICSVQMTKHKLYAFLFSKGGCSLTRLFPAMSLDCCARWGLGIEVSCSDMVLRFFLNQNISIGSVATYD